MAIKQPFDRLEGESSKAFEAFSVYRDLGVNRSTEQVAQRLSKSIAIIQRWSGLHNWVVRATAYDDYIDAEARKKLDRNAIKRKAKMLERHANTGRALQAFGLQHVQTTKQPANASDAIRAIRVGVDIERKSEGLPEYLIEVMNADDTELTAQYNELVAEIGGYRGGDEEAGDHSTGQDSASESSTTETE
jgi:hypothetical protein